MVYIYIYRLIFYTSILAAGVGAAFMISVLSFRGSDASRGGTKEAFRKVFHNRRFQIGGVCFVVGLAISMFFLYLMSRPAAAAPTAVRAALLFRYIPLPLDISYIYGVLERVGVNMIHIHMFTWIMGGLLFGVGAILMMSALSSKGSDFTWEGTKEAFREMFHNRRFQIGAVCFVVGIAISMFYLCVLMS